MNHLSSWTSTSAARHSGRCAGPGIDGAPHRRRDPRHHVERLGVGSGRPPSRRRRRPRRRRPARAGPELRRARAVRHPPPRRRRRAIDRPARSPVARRRPLDGRLRGDDGGGACTRTSFDDVLLVDGGAPLPGSPPAATSTQRSTRRSARRSTACAPTWPDRVVVPRRCGRNTRRSAEGISIDLERNLLADLVEVDGGFRTAVDEAAVRIDGRELLVDDEVRSLLDRRATPTDDRPRSERYDRASRRR